MRFHQTLTYDAGLDEVYAMLGDPAFREKVSVSLRTLSRNIEVTRQGEGMDVVVDQTQPSEGIPGFAKKIVGDKIHIRQEEVWSGPSEEATLEVTVPGKPGHFKGTIRLESDGSTTTETVQGEIKVHVPLVGGKLEKLISDLLGDALRSEESVGHDWLAAER